jgi:hypothetical protein
MFIQLCLRESQAEAHTALAYGSHLLPTAKRLSAKRKALFTTVAVFMMEMLELH